MDAFNAVQALYGRKKMIGVIVDRREKLRAESGGRSRTLVMIVIRPMTGKKKKNCARSGAIRRKQLQAGGR